MGDVKNYYKIIPQKWRDDYLLFGFLMSGVLDAGWAMFFHFQSLF